MALGWIEIGVLLTLATGAQPPAQDLLFASTASGDGEVYLLPAHASEPVNLSRSPGGDNWPVWSPDGSSIAFQSRRSGNLDIWTMRADGAEPMQLTDDPEPDYLPAWSPDGRTIVFTSWRKEPEDAERAPHLYRMNADGSGERRLVARSLETSAGATWTPDGRSLVYSRKAGKTGADLWRVDADGTNERQLTNDGPKNGYNGSPTVSPDGQWIAFYADDGTASKLDVMRLDGSARRSVVATGKNWYPRWSADGQWLVYTTAAPGGDAEDIDVYAVPVAGGEPVLLAGGAKRQQEASWRPAPAGAPAQTPADAFLAQLEPLCGQAFAGRIVANEPPNPNDAFAGKALVMHVRECRAGEVRIPFHVGEDRSRTWVLTRTATGLRLKHDHRHADGSEDAVTQYGGDTAAPGTAQRQEFPADAESRALFTRLGMTVSIPNVWAFELDPGRSFTYELARPGRLFRVEFDLTKPVPPPPAPWGAPPITAGERPPG